MLLIGFAFFFFQILAISGEKLAAGEYELTVNSESFQVKVCKLKDVESPRFVFCLKGTPGEKTSECSSEFCGFTAYTTAAEFKVDSGGQYKVVTTQCFEATIQSGKMDFPGFSKNCTWTADQLKKLLVKVETSDAYNVELIGAEVWKQVAKTAEANVWPDWAWIPVGIGAVIAVVILIWVIYCLVKKYLRKKSDKKEAVKVPEKTPSKTQNKDDEDDKKEAVKEPEKTPSKTQIKDDEEDKKKKKAGGILSGWFSKNSVEKHPKQEGKDGKEGDVDEARVSMDGHEKNAAAGPVGTASETKVEETQAKENGAKTPLPVSNGEMVKDKQTDIKPEAVVATVPEIKVEEKQAQEKEEKTPVRP
uniref:Transmembrane protein n=1 Tax=Panagrolaimus sp. JU765 TaxID=591449 RepID=A0AC34R6L3_9BILA